MGNLALLAFALLCGLIVGAFGVLIGAGGHGWVAASVSATAVLTAPAGAAAWLLRESRHGRRFAWVMVAVNGVVDSLFVALSLREGVAYKVDVFEHMAAAVVAWALVWLAWQAVPIVALVKRRAIKAG